jgi:hypothetical protein
MHSELERAKELLTTEGYTCVILKGDVCYNSTKRGIAPLMGYLADDIHMQGYFAADKVVGKAAAYLYVLLEIAELYVAVISVPALEVLQRFHIPVTYDILVPAIRNRTDTGFCPMETAVLNIQFADEAYKVLKAKINEMQN